MSGCVRACVCDAHKTRAVGVTGLIILFICCQAPQQQSNAEDHIVERGTALPSAFDVAVIVFQIDIRERQVAEAAETNLQAFYGQRDCLLPFEKMYVSQFLSSN